MSICFACKVKLQSRVLVFPITFFVKGGHFIISSKSVLCILSALLLLGDTKSKGIWLAKSVAARISRGLLLVETSRTRSNSSKVSWLNKKGK